MKVYYNCMYIYVLCYNHFNKYKPFKSKVKSIFCFEDVIANYFCTCAHKQEGQILRYELYIPVQNNCIFYEE